MVSPNFLRLPLLFGLLAGLVAFGYFYALYAAEALPLGSRRNLSIVFIWAGMALAVRQLVRVVRRPVRFGEAFLLCVLTLLVANVVEGLLVVGFIRYVDPELVPRFIQQIKQLALLDQARVKEQFGTNRDGQLVDFNEFLRQIEGINLRSIFWANFSVVRLGLGLLYSALIAVFFRRMSQFFPAKS
jgi:hypothetical protein